MDRRRMSKSVVVIRLIYPEPKTPLARIARSRQIVHITDIRTEPAYVERAPDVRCGLSMLLVPAPFSLFRCSRRTS